MDSSPPFGMEDQTDEDFFDKLVDDDDDLDFKGGVGGGGFVDGSESDEAKAFGDLSIGEGESEEKKNGGNELDEAKDFANLSIHEVESEEKNVVNGGNGGFVGGNELDEVKAFAILSIGEKNGDSGEELGWEGNGEVGGVCEGKGEVSLSGNVEGSNGAVVDGDIFGLDPTFDLNCGNNCSPTSSECTMISKSGGSGGSGIKEVGWNAFNTDSARDDNSGFGSYSDFFTDLGENAGNAIGSVGESATAKASEPSQSAYAGVSNGYDHYQDGYGYGHGAAAEQGTVAEHMNDSQYWESKYPGWKMDPATGQWYQVDGFDFRTSVQGNLEQKTAESVAETMTESGRTETVTNLNRISQQTENTGVASGWNQVSQVNGGYPSHMVFDPQYPGWYYDTIAKKWWSLDSYTASAQSAIQGQEQLNQNEFVGNNSYLHNNVQNTHGDYKQANQYTTSQSISSNGQDYNWGRSLHSYNLPASGVWEPERVKNQQLENHYKQDFSEVNRVSQQDGYQGSNSNYREVSQVQSEFPTVDRSHSFVSSGNATQFSFPRMEQNEPKVGSQSLDFLTQQFSQQYSYAPTQGRSSAGRPPHALVTFGFGGKLIMMKDTASQGNFSFATQNHSGYSVSVLNMSEVVTEKADVQSLRPGTCDYFHALCRQSLPGPLAGGNVGGKELNKWLDERISSSEFRDMDFRESNALRQLLSLLRIACQYYGKLRSPFGTDPMLKENDLPGLAVANLFSSAKGNAAQYGSVAHCLQGLPSETHLRATASEVQSLLVSGRKKEALHCAQEGQLWGPALVLAAQLGNQFYVDTVKQLALRQLVVGSPLRTLCLLIAGQPADVFSSDTAASGSMPGVVSSPQQSMQLGANGMLDDWEENLAVIASNRTKDDELVLIHLGDCLWRERADILAAHICYLVAEANFEQYSDSARMCLVGADHLKFPRTYASPEAIQRTEIYEYSQVLGNSQFVLIPFQPYKLVYAHMLAEVGRVSDALKYCQAVQKSLKTGRSPEVETLRLVASSLEERIKTHQQGGFSTNLDPTKLVGKLFNFIDSTAQLVTRGGLPPPVPSTLGGSTNGHENPNQPTGPRVSTSQSTMAMSSLMPSPSMEPITEWTGDGSRRPMHNRSVSEPDFGRSPRQGQVDSAKDASSTSDQGKSASRFGRFGFGSQLLQKTVGLVLKPRQERQAKLGDSNKFYYDEKLKRWVEEGAELPAQEAALPPPPPTSSFQNGSGTANYNLKSSVRDDGHLSNGTPESKSHHPIEHSSGMPPLPPTSNQFSARGRMGVRSRYVDTFNQGGGNSTNLFSSPSIPSVRPAAAAGTNPKFFVPAPVPSTESTPDNVEGSSATDENPAVSTVNDYSHHPASLSSVPMQRYPSMDNISSNVPTNGDPSLSAHSRRTASWSGSLNDSRSPTKRSETKPLGEVMGMPPSSFMPSGSPLMHSSVNSRSFGDELHEVEL